MSEIPFTQYLRPHGRPVPVTIDRPSNIADIARRLISVGYRFEIEELADRTVSMTVEDADVDTEGPLAIELCANGPDVPDTVDRLVRSAQATYAALNGPRHHPERR